MRGLILGMMISVVPSICYSGTNITVFPGKPVEITDGMTVDSINKASQFTESIGSVIMTGGTVRSMSLFNISSLDISGGGVDEAFLSSYGSSHYSIRGGDIGIRYLYAFDDSSIDIIGGKISGNPINFVVHQGGSINFRGIDLSFSDESGRLTGRLLDGTPIDVTMRYPQLDPDWHTVGSGDHFSIVGPAVPAPTSLILTATGLIGLIFRRIFT